MELNVEKFDPTVSELQAIVAETANITATDLTDKSQLKVVKSTRIKLRDARIKITKTGKELREEANAFNKAVLAKEKELLAIVEPEEIRLKSIEEEAERLETLKLRTVHLQIRRDALAQIGDGIEVSDEEILAMDDTQFVEYRNNRVSAKIEADRVALEAEKQRIAREQEIEAAKKQAAKEAEEKAKRDAEDRIRVAEQAQADAERREKEATERVEREKKEAEEREIAEKARLEKENGYKQWLNDNAFDDSTMKLFTVGDEVRMYKLVATYKK